MKNINDLLNKTYRLTNKNSLNKNINFKELKVGVDYGTALIKFLILNENNEPVLCSLEWANVVRDGIVTDYWGAVKITKRMAENTKKLLGIDKLPPVSGGFPPNTDPRLVKNVIYAAGLDVKKLIDEPSAAAKFLKINEGAVVDVGGGTTGIAIIKKKKVVKSFDEPTGGHHLTLVISGNQKIPYEKAELLKREDKEGKYFFIIKPVIEKMASIADNYTKRYRSIKSVYLVGGATLYKNFNSVFEDELNKEVISFNYPILITPFGITI